MMRKLFVLNLVALLIMSLAIPGMAVFADDITTLTFEDLEGQATIPENYGGLNWDPEWFYWGWEQPPYTPHSGLYRIATHNYGGYIDFSPLGYDVVFKGAWVSGRSETNLYMEGYRDGALIWTSETVVPSAEPYLLGDGQEALIDKVVLVSSHLNYFALDDLMYSGMTEVMVDVKPGSEDNPVNPKGKGVLPVALLGTDVFDATTVDPAAVYLTIDGSDMEIHPLRWAFEDVEYMDGMMDVMFHFNMQEVMTLIGEDPEGEYELILMGETFDGMPLMGMDTIMIVPDKK